NFYALITCPPYSTLLPYATLFRSQGGITTTLLQFTLPMLAGSLLQQCYNIADTLIVGQCIGANALAAVGSAYTLMVFLISILLGDRMSTRLNSSHVSISYADFFFK